MASYDTTCPVCQGEAHFNTDDGITWCDNPECRKPSCEYLDYSPPTRRGGMGTNTPQLKTKVNGN